MKSLRMRTIVGWQRAGVKAIGLTMLAACGSRPQFPPLNAAQRASVLEAAGQLQDTFNTSTGCDVIYEDSARAFQSYPKDRWLLDCARLQGDMGSWRSFRLHSIERCGMPETTVCVLGSAAFSKGGRILELTWSLDSGRAQLLSVAWPDDPEWIRIPPLPPRHKYRDTPPVPGKGQPDKRV
jgi:hypothetical protein